MNTLKPVGLNQPKDMFKLGSYVLGLLLHFRKNAVIQEFN